MNISLWFPRIYVSSQIMLGVDAINDVSDYSDIYKHVHSRRNDGLQEYGYVNIIKACLRKDFKACEPHHMVATCGKTIINVCPPDIKPLKGCLHRPFAANHRYSGSRIHSSLMLPNILSSEIALNFTGMLRIADDI